MKICITGGAGMIGSNLVKRLVFEDHEVKVIDNLWRGKLENFEINGNYLIDVDKDFFKLDLNDHANIQAVKDIIRDVDVVIHLADIVAGIGYVFKKQHEIFTLNNAINTNLFRACLNTDIKKLIYVGTACSFPLELQNSLDAELKDVDLFPANPESAYGWSKLIGQLELRYLSEIAEFEITTLMLHNVYGPNCEFEGERTQVIPSLINRIIEAKDGDTLEVWGSGLQGRAFIHVNDIVDAIIKTMNKYDLPAYMQIGPNYCTSIKELVNTLIDISGKKLNIHFDTTKPEGDKGRYANYENAYKVIGWSPNVKLFDGLKETYEWVKSKK
jgi:nucleoside-diphosphate-sugar epimerase